MTHPKDTDELKKLCPELDRVEVAKLLEWAAQAANKARLEMAKRFERATAAKFEELCKRVHTDPSFGNTAKHKKDNFLDGAENMVLIPSIIRADIEARLTAEKGSNE